ncbi:unnamed protein product [Schistocephalus solidus]|uniref:Uncharacterized protein n=1 Tax=Schistocephalus solidus TaxID=70667 RepID=A0A3P7C998_SCHSO|nr:unnamed protein product [Schistocephalus solidus]
MLRVVSDTNDFIHSARVDSGNVLVHRTVDQTFTNSFPCVTELARSAGGGRISYSLASFAMIVHAASCSVEAELQGQFFPFLRTKLNLTTTECAHRSHYGTCSSLCSLRLQQTTNPWPKVMQLRRERIPIHRPADTWRPNNRGCPSATCTFLPLGRRSVGHWTLSVSGISANVAVVAAYLMSLYELDSRTAVSVLQGLVHAAQPVHHLQDQLDRFGAGPVVPSTPPSSSPSQSPQVTAASEHARLLEKYGPWPGMEADRHCIEAALSSHDDLKASGVFLGDAEEDAAAVSLDAAAAYLKGAAKPTTSPEIIARSGEHADDDFFLEEDLDEPRNDLSGQEDPVEEDELSPATFPDEVGGDEGGSDGGDSEEEANEVVGSIPVPRGLMGAGDGGRQRFFAASYRPPPATKMASGNIDLGLDIASLMPDSDDRPAVHRTSQFATTAPAHGFFGWPM